MLTGLPVSSLGSEVMWCIHRGVGGGGVDEGRQAEADRVRMPGECVTTDWPVIWPTPGITHTLSHTHTPRKDARTMGESVFSLWLLVLTEIFFSSSIILSLDVTPSTPFIFHHNNCPRTLTGQTHCRTVCERIGGVNRENVLLINSEQAKLSNDKG